MDTLKRKEEIIQESAFDKKEKKKKKSGLKFNPVLALTAVRTTGAKKSPKNPNLNQATQKSTRQIILTKKSWNRKFQTQKNPSKKNPSIIPIT